MHYRWWGPRGNRDSKLLVSIKGGITAWPESWPSLLLMLWKSFEELRLGRCSLSPQCKEIFTTILEKQQPCNSPFPISNSKDLDKDAIRLVPSFSSKLQSLLFPKLFYKPNSINSQPADPRSTPYLSCMPNRIFLLRSHMPCLIRVCSVPAEKTTRPLKR